MRAAIYARYSSENQRPESIEDQVRSCRELAARHGFTVSSDHIFADEAKSGALRDRPGLDRLRAAAQEREFDAVLIDDLSRLSRDNHYLLTLYAEFRFHGVRIISRADSLDSEDDRAKLGFQMRGIVNELFLDDLREKTLRGQKGQKARGFSVGEATFGYRSHPVGDMRLDRRGRPRPEGYRMAIYGPEAEVVLRIFRSFADGISIKALVGDLNASGTPGKKGLRGRWSPSTVSRILKNEKYVGRWLWNRTETRRDPLTGRKRRLRKPETEWHVIEDPELRIVPEELWQCAVNRWHELDRVWPVPRAKREAQVKQRSYVETNPPHLLSGVLRCGSCGKAMGQVSGKGGGYYGCLSASKEACTNKLLVRRRLVERRVLEAVRERISDASSIHYVLTRVETEVRRLHADLPQSIRLTRSRLDAEERRVANFIEFIGDGKGTPLWGRPCPKPSGGSRSFARTSVSSNRPPAPSSKHRHSLGLRSASHQWAISSAGRRRARLSSCVGSWDPFGSPPFGPRSAGRTTRWKPPSRSSIFSTRPRRAVRTGCNSGGGGNRTPVRRCIPERVYECSR